MALYINDDGLHLQNGVLYGGDCACCDSPEETCGWIRGLDLECYPTDSLVFDIEWDKWENTHAGSALTGMEEWGQCVWDYGANLTNPFGLTVDN